MPARSASVQRRPQEQRTPPAPPPAALTKWAEVDVRALRDNARAICDHVGDGVAVMAMVKANGYGHGALTAARAALAGGARWLGVSSAEEAAALRAAGLEAPVLLTGWCHPGLAADLVASGVDVTVYDDDTLDAVVAGARAAGGVAAVHLKVDSGMTRLGARPAAVPDLCRRISALHESVRLRGVFTHFADAEADDAFTALQHERFLQAVEIARDTAPEVLVHAANSAAALGLPATWHQLVRVGISYYGYPPVAAPQVALRPAMTVCAIVTQVRTVRTGDSVGYGRSWRASRPARVATVAAGYADGVLRALSNRGAVLVRGARAPMVGRVSMDQVTVDVSEVEGVGGGDVAVVFGERDGARMDAGEVAEMAGTIPNEVLCGVTARVPRIEITGD